MRRFMVLITVVMLLAAMLVFAAPASAVSGCQTFGQATGVEGHTEHQVVGENVSAGAQEGGADDDVNFLKDQACDSE
jgi:hypothetical protein